MSKAAPLEDKNVRYRQKLRQAGEREVLFQLPDELVALIDDVKERHGLRSRSLALMQMIDRGREVTQ
jgi:hypothetical protein